MDPLVLDGSVFAETIEKYKPEIRDFYCEGRKDFSNYNSVSQGEIGDCWLLAPIAALGRSSLLRSVLENNFAINSDSKTYSVRLYDISGNSNYTIDGRLLYLPPTGDFESDLLFAGQQQFIPEKSKYTLKMLWFSFIEKAVALKLGGYHNLDGGDPNEPDAKQASLGFRLLTGRPVTTIMIDSTTDFANTIRGLLSSGAAIVYTTKSNVEIKAATNDSISVKSTPDDTEDKSGLNLLEDHAYVIDRISRDGTVQLYNPHGEFAKIASINKAKPLTNLQAIMFGKRLDIIKSGSVGGIRRRTLRVHSKATRLRKSRR